MLDNLTWNTETILILGIVTFVAFALLGIVIWNSKTNKQVKTLISIDDSLRHLEASEPTGTIPAAQSPVEETEPSSVKEETPVAEAIEIEEPKSKANVGRSGRVYTKEELEEQIR